MRIGVEIRYERTLTEPKLETNLLYRIQIVINGNPFQPLEMVVSDLKNNKKDVEYKEGNL